MQSNANGVDECNLNKHAMVLVKEIRWVTCTSKKETKKWEDSFFWVGSFIPWSILSHMMGLFPFDGYFSASAYG